MRTYTREFPGKKKREGDTHTHTHRSNTRASHITPSSQNVVNQRWFGSQIISAHCSRGWVIRRVNVILTAGLFGEARTRSSQSSTEAREGQILLIFHSRKHTRVRRSLGSKCKPMWGKINKICLFANAARLVLQNVTPPPL